MERREDLRFLRGRGEYVDDVAVPGMLYAVILRSSVAHGRLVSIDASAALEHAGRARGHHRRGHAGRPADHPDAAAAAAGIQAVRAAGDRARQGSLCRRAGGRGAGIVASRSARTRWKRSRSRSRSLPAVADWQAAAKNQSLLFEKPGTNRSLVFQVAQGRRGRGLRQRALRSPRAASHRAPYGLTDGAARRHGEWDDAAGRLTVYGAAKVPFFNRRILSAQIGLPVEQIDMIENDVGGGYGARGEFYPEDFLIPFAARHVQTPGEMDRGSPRKPDGDEPRARGGVRSRDRLRARRHDPRASAARSTPTWAPICAPTARSAPAMSASSWPAPIACRTSRSTRRCG